MKVGGMKLCPFFAEPRKGAIMYSLHLWHLLVDIVGKFVRDSRLMLCERFGVEPDLFPF